jgi:hypothetical protein
MKPRKKLRLSLYFFDIRRATIEIIRVLNPTWIRQKNTIAIRMPARNVFAFAKKSWSGLLSTSTCMRTIAAMRGITIEDGHGTRSEPKSVTNGCVKKNNNKVRNEVWAPENLRAIFQTRKAVNK